MRACVVVCICVRMNMCVHACETACKDCVLVKALEDNLKDIFTVSLS